MKEFTSEEEKAAYVNSQLDRVTTMLDQLADDTGDVYLVLKFSSIGSLLKLGMAVHKAIHDTEEVITRRMDKAGYVRDEEKGCWVCKDPPTQEPKDRAHGA